ncbi:MAG: RNA methyltransferase [Gammaproteobacteria bacterium]
MPAAIHIVLVDTTHPGNVGASARAMRNMGLDALVLVQPQAPADAESLTRAAGGADLLRAARIEQSVEAAIADCGLVLGTSARRRSAHHRVLDPRAAAAELVAASVSRPAALLFGGERNGLSNEDLARCHAVVRIPADPAYESLNLAQAVQILCYEIFLAAGAVPAVQGVDPPASAKELAALWDHLDAVARRAGFMHEGNASQLAPRIRRLLARAVPYAGEVRILRGLLAAIERRLPPEAAGP